MFGQCMGGGAAGEAFNDTETALDLDSTCCHDISAPNGQHIHGMRCSSLRTRSALMMLISSCGGGAAALCRRSLHAFSCIFVACDHKKTQKVGEKVKS